MEPMTLLYLFGTLEFGIVWTPDSGEVVWKMFSFVILALLLLFNNAVGFKCGSNMWLKPIAKVLKSSTTSVPPMSTSIPSEEIEVERAVYITPRAMTHLKSLKERQSNAFYLRMGVKSGGCSGMSYTMDFVDQESMTEDDYVENFENENIQCIIDPKSMLYLYGLHLDYSDELIGGGFKFTNPNADKSCGCGKSFGV